MAFSVSMPDGTVQQFGSPDEARAAIQKQLDQQNLDAAGKPKVPSQPDAPTQSIGEKAISYLRSLPGRVLAPENRAMLGGALGAGLTSGAAVALAPETGGLSLLLPVAGAMAGGAAGRASADLGTQGKVNPAGMIDSAVSQGTTQMAGELPGSLLASPVGRAAMDKLSLMGQKNALGGALTGSILDKVGPVRADAADQLARETLPFGLAGSSDAARAAQESVDSAQGRIQELLAGAPRDPQGRPLLGMMKKDNLAELQSLTSQLPDAQLRQTVLSRATKQPFLYEQLQSNAPLHARAIQLLTPGARTAQAARTLATQSIPSWGGDAVSNLARLAQMLGGGR